MDVIEAIHGRRSIRAYAPRPVERGIIESIIWDAAQAPPPFAGDVPWTFSVAECVERIAALGDEALQYARANHPAGPGWGWVDRPGFKVFWDAPVLVAISGRVEDCCRAGALLMLSAHARGLGTCWVGSPTPRLGTAKARETLGIPAGVEHVTAIVLGYASDAPAPVPPPRQKPPILWL